MTAIAHIAEVKFIEELFESFISSKANLSMIEALDLLRKYHSRILSLIEAAVEGKEKSKEVAALWSLCTLCFLEAPLQNSGQFLHGYIRWIQFYYADESGWVNFFEEQGLNDGVAESFWFSLLKLVASRHFEQACILLRRLILDRTGFYLRAPLQVELLLERLLEAPSPAQTLSTPEIFHRWIGDNREIFSNEITEWMPELDLIASLMMGDISRLSSVLNWKELLGANLLFTKTMCTFEDISIQANILATHTNFIDNVMASALQFDLSGVAELLKGDLSDNQLPLWFGAHFIDVLSRVSLITLDESDLFVSAWGRFLFETSRTSPMSIIALEYCNAARDIETGKRIIESLDESQIQAILARHHKDQMITSLCRMKLKAYALDKLSSQKYNEAYRLASLSNSNILVEKIVYHILTTYASSQDPAVLKTINFINDDKNSKVFELLSNLEEACLQDQTQIAVQLLECRFRLPQIVLSRLLTILNEWADHIRLPMDLLLRIMEIINSPQYHFSPGLKISTRLMVLKHFRF